MHNDVVKKSIKIANKIGYPVLIRPSYVLGGRAMEIAYDDQALESFAKTAMSVSSNNTILIDQYLENAKEIDVDLVRDSKGSIFVAGIMEHIEEAGIHSGDSACSLPPFSLNKKIEDKIINWISKIANEINVIGLMNTQLAVKENQLYVLEVNPRASRTVPFVAKSIGIPIAKIASKLAIGYTLDELDNQITKSTSAYFEPTLDYVVVKIPRWNFDKFKGSDIQLGLQMKSVGEVMSIGRSFQEALQKACQSLEIGRNGLGADGKGKTDQDEPDVPIFSLKQAQISLFLRTFLILLNGLTCIFIIINILHKW